MINSVIYSSEGGLRSCRQEDLKKWDYNCSENIWIDLYDPTAEESQIVLRDMFNFHPLAIEDSLKYLNDSQVHHPKTDDFGDYLFIVFNGIIPKAYGHDYSYHSLSCFLGHNFLVTVHNEKPDNSIEKSLQNYLTDTSFKKGPDYLLHLIFDSIVDNYYPILDKIEDEIAAVEESIFKNQPSNRILVNILALKKDLIKLMRSSSYQKEVLFKLTRADSDLISVDESMYYRNVYDHLVRISDSSQSYRDYVTGILDSYLSITNNRLNETMKYLTTISTIMLPLTFLTGLFGMNFVHIPFLESKWGFFASLGLMAAVGVMMWYWFRQRKMI